MTRSRVWPVLVSAALACSLAACGGKDDKASDLPTLTPDPTTATSTPPSTPATPTAVPTQTVGKYGDLTLDLRRPATGQTKAEPAVALFLSLHQSFATMASGGAAPAELSQIATSGVIKTLNTLLAAQRKAKEHAGGALTVRVTAAEASTSVAVVDGCFDQRKLVMIRSNGTRYVDPTVKRSPTLVARVTVSGSAGHRLVSGFSLKEKAC
jgi:hypothetical protein